MSLSQFDFVQLFSTISGEHLCELCRHTYAHAHRHAHTHALTQSYILTYINTYILKDKERNR